MNIDAVREAVKAQKNRCDIVLLICSQEQAYLLSDLLHTALEDMQEAEQAITEEFCVVK